MGTRAFFEHFRGFEFFSGGAEAPSRPAHLRLTLAVGRLVPTRHRHREDLNDE
jgi:hypothetical protein